MSEHLDTVRGAERDTSTPRTSDPSVGLGGCASECSIVAPPRVQPEEVEDTSETQRGGSGHANTYKALIGTLKESLPEDSTLRRYNHPYLGDRLRAAAALHLHGQDGETHFEFHSPKRVWAQLEAANPEHAILVVEGIDDIWCNALCARYPQSINERFLLEHILGLTFEFVNKEMHSPAPMDHSVEADIRLIADALSDRVDLFHADENGFHVNYWYELDRRPRNTVQHLRGACILQYHKSAWAKSNRFISGCRLDKNFYLVLLPPRLFEMMHEEALSGRLHVSYRFRGYLNRPLTTDLPPCPVFRMTAALSNLLASEWPVFVWKTTASGKNSASAQDNLDCYLPATLLILSVLRCDVDSAKDAMISLAYPQQHIDDHVHFAELTRFRRILGRLHHAINNLLFSARHSQIDLLLDGAVYRLDLSPTQSPHTATAVPSEASPQPNLKEVICDWLSPLQATLSAIKAALNEELQVAVGAVQVKDAQVTQTQTNMTVVLTILAAIYLPMTLVTGIFGMNVAEINRIANSPKAWLVVVAWVVSIVVTVGSGLLVWKLWKLWTAKKARKQSDIETGYESHDSGTSRWRFKQE